ncbi:MAG: glycoside hydrolase family 16 protein [Tessaracoccus sp.]|uniref:glycoside hydrolase family 16 protein n=1 Tax=Tessaracoccus sp. TaxID=1971211 RepID=UPI001EB19D3E|nr:glycoside hydrolase family 16 protein [Tessaracoccus sp.]MBK7820156.1 glycoside hydrolase family 16 protein [Tessaracoccus sp.]
MSPRDAISRRRVAGYAVAGVLVVVGLAAATASLRGIGGGAVPQIAPSVSQSPAPTRVASPEPSDSPTPEPSPTPDAEPTPEKVDLSAAALKADGWKRVFRDDFKGSRLGDAWTTRAPGVYAGSRLCSAPRPEMARVEDGKFIASIRKLDADSSADREEIQAVERAARKAQKDKKAAAIAAAEKLKGDERAEALEKAQAIDVEGCPEGVFANGMVDTSTSFRIPEGIVAARVKFPVGQGMHGSVWIQTTRNNGTQTPKGAEIDMIEAFGYGKGVSNIVHADVEENGKLTQLGGYVLEDAAADRQWWDEYHVFSVEWTRKEFIFRLDGVETSRIKATAVKGDEYILIMSLLTSDWELPLLTEPKQSLPGVVETDLGEASMSVDWIEAWEKRN